MKKLLNQKSHDQFVVKKTWQRYVICNQAYYTPAMQRLLQNPDAGLDGRMLKVDTTTTVGMTEVDGQALVIKRFNIKGFCHALKRLIQPTRAKHCWYNAHRLLELNICTPKPIAMIERRFGPLRGKGYYIYQFVNGALASDRFIAADKNKDETSELAERVTAAIQKMRLHCIYHGDLKATNIIIAHGQPYFIDLDAMRSYRSKFMFKGKRHKDITRFIQNWDDNPEIKGMFQKLLNQN